MSCIAYLYYLHRIDINEKLQSSSKKIEMSLRSQLDLILLECSNFLNEIKLKKYQAVYKDDHRNLKIILPSPILNKKAFLSHQIKIGSPHVNKSSGLWILTIRIDILDENNVTIGNFEKKVNQREFAEQIKNHIGLPGVFYAIFDKSYNFILKSDNNTHHLESIKYISFFQKHTVPSKGNLFSQDYNEFVYCSPILNSPFFILAGVDSTQFFSSVWKQVRFVTILFSVLLIGTLSILKHAAFRVSKDFIDFCGKTKKYYFKFSMDTILDHLRGLSYINIPQSNQESINNDPHEKIYIYQLIEDCLSLLLDKINAHKIRIVLSVNNKIDIYSDPFLLKKILVSLLEFAIDHNKEKNIYISTISSHKNLLIKIEDDSFYLNETLREEVSKKLKPDNYFILSYKNIKELATLYGIDITIKERFPRGNEVTIIIPYQTAFKNISTGNNVVAFNKNSSSIEKSTN